MNSNKKTLKIYEFENSLYYYSGFIIAHNKSEAIKIYEQKWRGHGETDYVQEHKIEHGKFFEGGGNG